jgi:hypothetical protein
LELRKSKPPGPGSYEVLGERVKAFVKVKSDKCQFIAECRYSGL